MITLKVCERMTVETESISSPSYLKSYILRHLSDVAKSDQESFWIIPMNNKHACKAPILIALGGRSEATVDLKVLFRRLLIEGASAFAVCHNHPSGGWEAATASNEDIDLTKRIKQVADVIGIRFLDHFILYMMDDKRAEAQSMHEQGLI